MLDAKRRVLPGALSQPVTPATPTNGLHRPADDAPVPAVAAEAEARAVNLGRRFFNVRTLLSFALGIAILVGLLRVTNIHPEEILAQLRQVDGRLLAVAFASYLLTFPCRGVRWQRLLRNVGSHVRVAPLTEVIFISWFVNSVLPGKIGDVYRGYLLRREYGHSLSRTVGTVVAERVLDLTGLVLLLGTTGYLVLRNRVSPVIDQMLLAAWVGLAVLFCGLLIAHRYGERLVAFLPEKVRVIYGKFAHGTFASFGPAREIPWLGLLTALAWAAEAGRLFFVMQSLNVGLGPLAALFTVAAVSLALIVPTPGGLGGVESAFVVVLAVFGVPLHLALAVALLDRLISYYSLIVFGLPAFLFTKRGR